MRTILKHKVLEELTSEGSEETSTISTTSSEGEVSTDGQEESTISEMTDDSEDFVANEGLLDDVDASEEVQVASEEEDEVIPEGSEEEAEASTDEESRKVEEETEEPEKKDEVEKPTETDESEETPEELPTEEETPQLSAEELQEQRVKDRETAVTQLAETYGMSEEEGQELVANPEKHIPQRMAKMHVNILEGVLSGLARNLPSMLQNVTTAQDTAAKARKDFYNTWPKLNKKPEYQATATRLALLYRQANPGADEQTVINEVGLAAMIAHKIELPASFAEEAPSEEKPRQSAASKSSAGKPVQTQSTNEFERLAEEDA